MSFTNINKHEVSRDLEQIFKFIQSRVDIGNLFHIVILLCSEETYLKVGWIPDIVLLGCDRELSLF